MERAAIKAIKQGDAGLGGQRSLQALMAEYMQSDIAGFLQLMVKLDPAAVRIDIDVSVRNALDEARGRIIDAQAFQALGTQDAQVLEQAIGGEAEAEEVGRVGGGDESESSD